MAWWRWGLNRDEDSYHNTTFDGCIGHELQAAYASDRQWVRLHIFMQTRPTDSGCYWRSGYNNGDCFRWFSLPFHTRQSFPVPTQEWIICSFGYWVHGGHSRAEPRHTIIRARSRKIALHCISIRLTRILPSGKGRMTIRRNGRTDRITLHAKMADITIVTLRNQIR